MRFEGFSEFWKEKRLDQIATIERGRFSPRPRNNPIYYNGDIPFVQTSDVVNSNGEIDSYSQTLNEKGLKVSKLFPKGTILITIAANIGYSGVLQKDMACPDSLVGLKCGKETNNVFLNYTLIKEQPNMDYLAVAAAQKNINIEFLKPYKVFIPTLNEQIRLATFLSLLDKRIQTQNEIIEDYKLLKKGMMQKLFKQEIRFKDENGDYYIEWEEKQLGQVFSSVKGKGLSKDKLVKNGDYKCVLYGELYTTYQEIIYTVVSFTNVKEGESSKEGDLLVPCSTTTTGIDLANVTAINEDNVRLGGDITILRAKQNIDSVFFAYYLSNHKKSELSSYAQGSTIVHLYYNHFKAMKIAFPHIKEQQKIAATLSSIDSKIELENQVLNQLNEQKQYFLQNLFI